MAINTMLFTVSTSFTAAIGLISFFIMYNTSRKIEDELVKQFSQRLMMLIGVMLLFLSYWAYYTIALSNVPFAQYPLFLSIIFVFVYLMWNTLTFRKLSLSTETKLDKMEKGKGF